jgi:hypothetical protein
VRLPRTSAAPTELAALAVPRAEIRPAVGYVHVLDGDEETINGLHQQLATQAQRAGLHLVEVYVDRQAVDDETGRPALALAVDEIDRYQTPYCFYLTCLACQRHREAGRP